MSAKVEQQPVSTPHDDQTDGAADPDPSATQPIILHFLQEASKLAAPSHGSLVNSAFDPYTSETKDARASDNASDAYSQRGWAQAFSYRGGGDRDLYVIKTHAGPDPQGSNPWEVMSLINLQCEKLLHRSERGASDCASPSLFSSSDSNSVTYAPSSPSASDDSGPARRHTTSGKMSSRTESGPCTGGRALPVDENAGLRSQSAHRAAAEEVQLSVVTGSEREASASKEGGTSSDEAPPPTHPSPAADGTLGNVGDQPARTSNQVVCSAHGYFVSQQLTADPALALDFNSNLILTFDPLGDAHALPSTPKQPVFSDEELSQNKHQPNAKTTEPEEEDTQTPTGSQQCPGTSPTCRAKTRRKQAHPTRSVDAADPDLQGVMFCMQGELDHSRGQCRLLVASKYRRKPRLRTRSSQSSLRTSSSDEDPDTSTSVSKSKECASCCTKKTPMWRDAEDGTPLCNACGIRYKKYRVRCANCWHIPRKEGNSTSRCLKCGNSVRLTSALRKQTAW